MTVAGEIIAMALKKIGKPHSHIEITDGVFPLHSMLANWETQRIDTGIVLPTAPDSDLEEPAGVRNAIITNLAMHLATSSDAIPEWFVGLANWEFNGLEILCKREEKKSRGPSMGRFN